MDERQEALATGRKRPMNSSPVPSITIQVNKADAQQFMKASDAIAMKLLGASPNNTSTAPQRESEGASNNSSSAPLHETLHQAALECNEEAVTRYKNRLSASSLTQPERKASFLLFHRSDFDEKLEAFFLAFSAGLDDDLPRPDLLSFFRTLLTSVTSCCATETSQIVVEGRPEQTEPQRKKVKREEDTVSTKEMTECNTSPKDLHTTSFDFSVATAQDEDQQELLKEIEDVAVFATDQVLSFVKEKSLAKASVHALNGWYKEKGRSVAPWLELLSLSKWKALAQTGDTQTPQAVSTPPGTRAPLAPAVLSPSHEPSSPDPESLSASTKPTPELTKEPPPPLQHPQATKVPSSKSKLDSPPALQHSSESKEPSPVSEPPRSAVKKRSPAGVSRLPSNQSLALQKPSSTSKHPSPVQRHQSSEEHVPAQCPPSSAPSPPSSSALDLPSPSQRLAPRLRHAAAENKQPPSFTHSSPSDKENRRTQSKCADQPLFKDTLFDEPPRNEMFPPDSGRDTSKPLVSFDFSGSGHPKPLCIEISENNLYALRHFVHRSGLMNLPASVMCKKLLRLANRRATGRESIVTLSRGVWLNSISDIVGVDVWGQLSSSEREAFTGCFTEIFTCFEGNRSALRSDEVDLQEFAIGFCFFCSGNKSSKLATGFEVLDDQRRSYLTEEHLRRYLTSYLTMLVAMSVLAPISAQNSSGVIARLHHRDMKSAVESGAKWTLGHFLRHFGDFGKGRHSGRYSFESFASWYSSGGYEVAPWLELLDLNKVFSLIGNSRFDRDIPSASALAPQSRDKMSSLRRHHSTRKGPPPEILFTFPLANTRSLVVLKDDATYVRGVVDQLGLLSMNPNELWAHLSRLVENKKKTGDASQGTVYVSMETFLSCMEDICPSLKRIKSNRHDRTKTTEILSNFFQCFDLEQRNSVAVDELMGGLTLLCGGKKSHKLAFAFGVFDTRPGIQLKKKTENITHSLSGEDLFLFLRSILIVTFSCCRQSLDMTDGMVGRCIADTANMICNDVMRHQWDLRHKDRLNFDEFGQWYNDGGFERAPWLELLDLNKWVLVEPLDSVKKRQGRSAVLTNPAPPSMPNTDQVVPPPPPEDELDPDFFESSIMHMESMDEMDMILMQPSKDNDLDLGSPRMGHFPNSPEPAYLLSPTPAPVRQKPPLKFHLSTSDIHGGYSLSMSHRRISHLRRILESSSLHKMSAEIVCNKILSQATMSTNPKLTQETFNAAVSDILSSAHPGARDEERTLFRVLSGIFSAFDRDGSGGVGAIELACGFTVLCHGKKSDKLEFAFDVLDKRTRGQLSREDMTNYLKSFLTVLLSIAFSPSLKDDANVESSLVTLQGRQCDQSPRTLVSVVDSAAHWATSMAFEGHISRHRSDKCMSMSFDDFADWYTSKGYSSIPWLELLDLRKWVFTKETH